MIKPLALKKIDKDSDLWKVGESRVLPEQESRQPPQPTLRQPTLPPETKSYRSRRLLLHNQYLRQEVNHYYPQYYRAKSLESPVNSPRQEARIPRRKSCYNHDYLGNASKPINFTRYGSQQRGLNNPYQKNYVGQLGGQYGTQGKYGAQYGGQQRGQYLGQQGGQLGQKTQYGDQLAGQYGGQKGSSQYAGQYGGQHAVQYGGQMAGHYGGHMAGQYGGQQASQYGGQQVSKYNRRYNRRAGYFIRR